MKCDVNDCTYEAKRICHFDGEVNYYYCFWHRDSMRLVGLMEKKPLREQPIGVHLMEKDSQ